MCMWPFKSKFEKLKRDDVVNAIIDLEKQESDMEAQMMSKIKEISDLMAKGTAEQNRDLKIFYAKKINHLKEEKENDMKRATYLLYNIRLMKKLKDSIDENAFFLNAGKTSLNNLLSDQKGLAKFLNNALNTKVRAEDVLTSADETFSEIQNAYVQNESIYGVNNNDDQLLAIFETGDQLGADLGIGEEQSHKAESQAE